MRKLLSLTKRPDPSTQPKVDPAKVALSEQLGVRFIQRDYRYICQKLVVAYEERFGRQSSISHSKVFLAELSRTWIDVPLVPEAYYP